MAAAADDERYQDGRVYKLVNQNDPTEIYVGSTIRSLQIRLHGHRVDMEKGATSTLYCRMRELGFDTFSIHLIEPWFCASRTELRQREQHWINQLEPSLNEKRALMTKEDRIKDNSQGCKLYYQANKVAIKARKAEKIKCEKCEKLVARACMARHRRENCMG
jgi:hypothetical protein